MTNQEATEFLKENVKYLEDRINESVDITMDDADVEVFKLAIKALEKQIPKKPTDTWEKDIERQRRHLCRWACPDCGTFLGFENKHCTECGAKIKWDAIA